MHIKYVINQHHCDKTKDYPHVDPWIKENLYFQYTKTCLCLFYFILWQGIVFVFFTLLAFDNQKMLVKNIVQFLNIRMLLINE